jgi:hypothetical protein
MSFIPKSYMEVPTTKWNEFVLRQQKCWFALEKFVSSSVFDPYDILIKDRNGYPRSTARYLALSMIVATPKKEKGQPGLCIPRLIGVHLTFGKEAVLVFFALLFLQVICWTLTSTLRI